jgi:hypothetical protein
MTDKKWLIDANALMDLARNHVGGTVDCNDIARFPTVDAAPVVHGRWIERRHEGMGGGWYLLFHCSECDTPSARPRNYCSFCGAKMDLK